MSITENRRRAPRITTQDWEGRRRVEGDPEELAEPCTVLDISSLGTGIEMTGGRHDHHRYDHLVDQRVVVEVEPPIGKSITLRMVSHVKNVIPGSFGSIRIGIEFVDLSAAELSILGVFAALNGHLLPHRHFSLMRLMSNHTEKS